MDYFLQKETGKSRRDFACKCGCGFDTIDYELVRVIGYLLNYLEAYGFQATCAARSCVGARESGSVSSW